MFRKEFLAVALLLPLLAACDNPEQKANALFVEAAQALTDAQAAADPMQQYDQLTAAKKTVTEIVSGYPGSSAAVRISANERIGPYSLADLNAAIASLAQRPELCLRALTQACLADMVIGTLDKLLKHDPSKRPDPAVVQLALNGLPFANIVAPDRVQALFASMPDGIKTNSVLMAQSIAQELTTPLLLNMIATVKGEQAVADAITRLNTIPGYRDAAVQDLNRLSYAFLSSRTPESAKLLKAAAKALQDPLPDTAQQQILKEVCKLSTNAEENAIVIADCTASELIGGNTYFGYIPADRREALYEAASTPEKKLAVANNIFNSLSTLDERLAWFERTNYTASLDTLAHLYVDATREGHRARPTIIAKLEHAKDGTLDNAALTQAGLTPKNILLHHANGTLPAQLPAIYQAIQAQPRFSQQLYDSLTHLTRLQPITPGMDQMAFLTLLGQTLATWTENDSASKKIMQSTALHTYPKESDPRPVYDALYAGAPYHADLSYEVVRRFMAHGHTDIVEKAIAASNPIEHTHSLRFDLVRQEVYDLAEAGDISGAVAKLDALPFFTRYYIMGHGLQSGGTLLTQKARDALRTALLEKFPYDLTAFELGWRQNLGVPLQLKLDTITANYTKLTEFLKTSPADWLIQSFGTFTPAQRLQALKAMQQANEPLWPVYASAIVMVQD